MNSSNRDVTVRLDPDSIFNHVAAFRTALDPTDANPPNTPTIAILGPADPTASTIQISAASTQAGSTITVTLTADDANGNQETTGGSTVVFSLGSGNAQGTFSAVTDNGDGTYAATFIATTAGTNTISATIDGQAVTSSAPTVTVAEPPFSLVIDPYLIDPNAPTTPSKPLFYIPDSSFSDILWLDGNAQSLVPPVAQPLTQ